MDDGMVDNGGRIDDDDDDDIFSLGALLIKDGCISHAASKA